MENLDFTEVLINAVDTYGYFNRFSLVLKEKLMTHFNAEQIAEMERPPKIEHRSHPLLLQAVKEVGLHRCNSESSGQWMIQLIPTLALPFAKIEYVQVETKLQDETIVASSAKERIIYAELDALVIELLQHQLSTDQLEEILGHCSEHSS